VRVLVLGSAGQVGSELMTLLPAFATVVGMDVGEVDVADPASLRAAVAAAEPHAIVNAAAYNDVDKAEGDEATATAVNGRAVGVLGEEAAERRALLVHYSTDFVFDGTATEPYRETDAPSPLGAYARSKLLGERLLEQIGAPAIVFRTAWVYGLRGKSFVRTILKAARERSTLRVVDDQVGCPTSARDLAVATAFLLYAGRADPFGALAGARGVYHLAGGGYTSRFELARAALELDPRKAEHQARAVLPIRSSELAQAARRPAFAPLDCSRARERFGLELPPWRESLRHVLRELEPRP
jgi:dTDP-4-dehydrorhamnose reductase